MTRKIKISRANRLIFANVFLSLSFDLFHASPAIAQLPMGASVRAGTVNSTVTNGQMLITQSTAKSIIDWNSFSIGQGNAVRFLQPNSSSISLNRVIGTEATTINGSLLANGQVWLLNPNGMLIGSTGNVSAAGFVGSTRSMSDADFLAGNYKFTAPTNSVSSVINLGTISGATGGYAALLGEQVRNEGLIQADLGTVLLGGGKTFVIDVVGDKLLSFAITSPVEVAPGDGRFLVNNAGTIKADGGRVLISAQAANQLIGGVINTTGLIQANSVSLVNGQLVLGNVEVDGGEKGQVTIDGTITVSAVEGGKAGAIKISGEVISVESKAKLEAIGFAGGGDILMGAGWQGAHLGRSPIAHSVTVASGATLDASAADSGNGGTIVAYSNIHDSSSKTQVGGSFKATGGENGGDGGRIETSGASVLNTGVVVNAGSKRGRPGQWLVDPIDIVIDSTWADSINSSLNADTSVTVSVENSPSGQPQLWVQNPIGKSSGILETSLILASDYSIIFSAPITNSASGALNLNVIAPWVYLRNNVTTKGSQTYQIAGLVVDVDTTLKSFNSPISIHGNVDSPNTGTSPQQPHRLTVDAGNSTASFYGDIGYHFPLQALTVSALGGIKNGSSAGPSATSSTLNSPLGVTTVGAQSYTGALTLNADTRLSTSNSPISFSDSIDSYTSGDPRSLSVNAGTSTVRFGGSIGEIAALNNLEVIANGGIIGGAIGGAIGGNSSGSVTTVGAQRYTGAVILNSDIRLSTSNSPIWFSDSIDSDGLGGPRSLSVNAGTSTVRFGGSIGAVAALNNLEVTANGGIIGGGSGGNSPGSVTTVGAQRYTGAVTLNSDIRLSTSNSPIWFSDSIDSDGLGGPRSLSVNAGTSTVRFGGSIGEIAALNNLEVTANGGIIGGAIGGAIGGNSSGSVTTVGAQRYTGAVILNSDIRLSTSNSPIWFSDSIDSDGLGGPRSLSVNAGTSTVRFGGSIGEIAALNNLEVTANGGIIGGAIGGNSPGSVTTVGSQSYAGAVTLNADTRFSSSNGPISFFGAIDSSGATDPANLSVNAGTTARFGGSIGAVAALDNLEVTANGGMIVGGSGGNSPISVTTVGAQRYTGAVTLNSDIRLSTSNSPIGFFDSIDSYSFGGPRSLSVNAGTGLVGFGGSIGAVAALNNLEVIANGGIFMRSPPNNFNTSVSTVGSQNYMGPFTFNSGEAISTAGSSGNLALNASGLISVDGRMSVLGTTNISAGNGNINMANVGNDFSGSVSVSSGGHVTIVAANALLLGGVSATGDVSIKTRTGNLKVTQNISTTSTSNSAVILNAGVDSSVGDINGGDIVLDGNATINTGSGGRASLYTGGVASSVDLSRLIGSEASRIRYFSNELSTNYSSPLGSGTYVLYREQAPVVSTVTTIASIWVPPPVTVLAAPTPVTLEVAPPAPQAAPPAEVAPTGGLGPAGGATPEQNAPQLSGGPVAQPLPEGPPPSQAIGAGASPPPMTDQAAPVAAAPPPVAPAPTQVAATAGAGGPTPTGQAAPAPAAPIPVAGSGGPALAPPNAPGPVVQAPAPAPVAVANPAAAAITVVAPAPVSPVGNTKPQTPKDSADQGDKLLANAEPPAPPKPAPQAKRTTQAPQSVNIGLVNVQQGVPARAPTNPMSERRFSESGNRANW